MTFAKLIIHTKCYKNWLPTYILWQQQLIVTFLAYFDPKSTYNAKSDMFFTYVLINFLMWTLQCTETLILLLFCP